MSVIRNARIEGGLWIDRKNEPVLVTGCLFTQAKATKRQLVRWYWQRLRNRA